MELRPWFALACTTAALVTGAPAFAQTPSYNTAIYAPGGGSANLGNGVYITKAMAVDANGNVYVTGSMTAGTTFDFLTTKLSPSGAILWQKTFAGPAGKSDAALAVAIDASGNAIVTGPSTNAAGLGDIKTIKYATDGTVLWERLVDGNRDDASYAIAVDASNNIVIAGESINTAGNADIRVLKYAADGTLAWSKTFDFGYDDFMSDLAVDASGNIAVSGVSQNAAGNADWRVVRIAGATGAQLWQQSFDGGGEDQTYAVAADSGGNVLVAGYAVVNGNANARVAKYAAADGRPLWQSSAGGAGADLAQGLAVDASGNAVVAIQFQNASGNYDFRTIKLASTDGRAIWDKTFNSGGNDYAYAVAIDAAGNAVTVGSVANASGITDWKVIRYSGTDGTLLEEPTYAGTAGQDDDAFAVAANATGVYVGGTSSATGLPESARVIRYAWTAGGAAPSNVPTPVAPTGAIATATPTYSWSAVAGASAYYLLVQNTAGVAVGISYAAAAAGCGAGTGTCSVTPSTALSNNTTYVWFVNATNAGVTSPWSAGTTIRVSGVATPPPAPNAPVLVSPSGSISTTTPTYTWNAWSGATSYYLLVQNTAGVAVSQSVSAAAAGCATAATCSFASSSPLSSGAVYNWFVNATAATATTPWSAPLAVTVSAAAPPPPPSSAIPVLASPSGTITTATPAYSWSAVTGATSYYLVVQNTAGVAVGTSYSAAAADCASGDTCSVTPSTALSNNTTYNWFVNATTPSATTPWSAGKTIDVNAQSASGPPATPVTVGPSGTLATTTPTYTWSASTGATSYYLLVQNTSGVAVGMSVSAASAGCASGGTCTSTPSTALAARTSYNWFVNASNSFGTSAWSAGKAITSP